MQLLATLQKSTINIPLGSKVSITKVGKTDGYDGHCLRAYSYFGTQMPDIINTVDSINSIKKKYPNLRSDSKAPTFLLTLILASFTGDSNEKLL